MKKIIMFLLCVSLILGINLYFENKRNEIKKVLEPKNTEIIHFSRYAENEEDEMLYSVKNSSEKKAELLEIISKAERRNYKEKFEYESGEKQYTVHFTCDKGQRWMTFGSKCYVYEFYGKGYEIINGEEILKEIEAFVEENGE